MRTLSLILVVACSHAAPAPTTPCATPTVPATPPRPPVTFTPRADLPPLPEVGSNMMGWPDWSHEQKLAFMTKTVMPAERELFMKFMPQRFASMTCETCHGQGARDGTYRMPNPDLPHITGGKGGFTEMAAVEPEVVKFMQSEVGPATGKMLGYPTFDMARHVGFSCYQCHVRDDVRD